MASRQREWQWRMRAQGRCVICGEPGKTTRRGTAGERCEKHARKRRKTKTRAAQDRANEAARKKRAEARAACEANTICSKCERRGHSARNCELEISPQRVRYRQLRRRGMCTVCGTRKAALRRDGKPAARCESCRNDRRPSLASQRRQDAKRKAQRAVRRKLLGGRRRASDHKPLTCSACGTVGHTKLTCEKERDHEERKFPARDFGSPDERGEREDHAAGG